MAVAPSTVPIPPRTAPAPHRGERAAPSHRSLRDPPFHRGGASVPPGRWPCSAQKYAVTCPQIARFHPSWVTAARSSWPLLRHRLLLEAHGFEGFGAVLVLEDIDDSAVPHLHVQVEPDIDLRATAPAAAFEMKDDEEIVAGVEYFLDFQVVLRPGVEPSAANPLRCLHAVERGVVLLKGRPFDLGMRKLDEGVRVVLEGPSPAPHHLHVLLRHRLPLKAHGFEGRF